MRYNAYMVYLCVITDYMGALATTCKDKGDMSGFDRYFALYESLTDTCLQCEDEPTDTDMHVFVLDFPSCEFVKVGVA